MEKKKNEYPSHVRTNRDAFIHSRIENAKKILIIDKKRACISDREALRFLLDETNNGNGIEITHTQLKIFKEMCCLWDPVMKKFPFTQLGQVVNQLHDGLLVGDEIKQGLMNLLAKGNTNFMKKEEEKKDDKV